MKSVLSSLLCLLAIGVAARADDATPMKKVLFFSKSSNFIHDPIKTVMADGRRGYAFPVLEALAKKDHIDMVFSKDGSIFTKEGLAPFDAIIFYTSGDLTKSKTDPKMSPGLFAGDGEPPMPAGGKQALLDAIAAGKGFVGIHSAADTFHTNGTYAHGPLRFLPDGDKADPYAKMLGGEFIQHGKQQVSHLEIADPTFPGVSSKPSDYSFMEEWYSLKNFAPDDHVILVTQTKGMTGIEYARPAYPSTWIHLYGKGRVFYTALGHREDLWNNPVYQNLLTGAFDWVLHRVDADTTPNISKVAPGAYTLPKYVEPTK